MGSLGQQCFELRQIEEKKKAQRGKREEPRWALKNLVDNYSGEAGV